MILQEIITSFLFILVFHFLYDHGKIVLHEKGFFSDAKFCMHVESNGVKKVPVLTLSFFPPLIDL